MTSYQIGFGLEIVNPPLGSPMAGFDARQGVAEGVHDDLCARAVAVNDALLISVDVIGFDTGFTRLTREAIAARTGIPAARIILAGTHTHCGPVTFNHFFNQGQKLDDVYLAALRAKIVDAAAAAVADRRPARLRTGLAPVADVARNRRSPDAQPVDPYAGVFLAEPLDGTAPIIGVTYACHPTVLGPDTLQLSADFPGYAVRYLESTAQARALFFQSSEGDLSMGHSSALSAVGVIAPSRTFAKAEELGTRLGRAVLDSLAALTEAEGPVAVETLLLDLPTKSYAAPDEMARRREQAASDVAAATDDDALIRAKQRHLYSRIEEYYATLPRELTVELTAIRLGDAAFVSIPGELFVSIALDIRRQSPLPKTFVVGLANGYIGYIPTADARADSGYEVTAAHVSPAAAGVLTNGCVTLLRALAR